VLVATLARGGAACSGVQGLQRMLAGRGAEPSGEAALWVSIGRQSLGLGTNGAVLVATSAIDICPANISRLF